MRYLAGFMKLTNLIRLIRYRFFLFAGVLPYFLGQAIAFSLHKTLNYAFCWWGFVGILLVLAAVELFNEYFDSKEGGDRIFSQAESDIPNYFFGLGILAVGLAFIIALYLTLQTGWPVLLFSFLGFLGAYFYVGPPIKWAYRGFGETVIALCYGPFMVLGSYYIQTQRIDFVPFFVSLVSGLSVFCLAVTNEIPDFYQDRLVGKKNIVVRIGRQKAVVLLGFCFTGIFLLLALGIISRNIPPLSMVAAVALPWLLKSMKIAQKNYDNPEAFVFAVNTIVITHIVIVLSLGISFLMD
ncbi:MAG: UbiA family prenyltransferase [Planctomycetota bacterium]|jgi:1,4-dihydroxy-2-naphthoate octaprenyltransferase